MIEIELPVTVTFASKATNKGVTHDYTMLRCDYNPGFDPNLSYTAYVYADTSIVKGVPLTGAKVFLYRLGEDLNVFGGAPDTLLHEGVTDRYEVLLPNGVPRTTSTGTYFYVDGTTSKRYWTRNSGAWATMPTQFLTKLTAGTIYGIKIYGDEGWYAATADPDPEKWPRIIAMIEGDPATKPTLVGPERVLPGEGVNLSWQCENASSYILWADGVETQISGNTATVSTDWTAGAARTFKVRGVGLYNSLGPWSNEVSVLILAPPPAPMPLHPVNGGVVSRNALVAARLPQTDRLWLEVFDGERWLSCAASPGGGACVRYANLPVGEKKFLLRVRDEYGQLSEETEVVCRVEEFADENLADKPVKAQDINRLRELVSAVTGASFAEIIAGEKVFFRHITDAFTALDVYAAALNAECGAGLAVGDWPAVASGSPLLCAQPLAVYARLRQF